MTDKEEEKQEQQQQKEETTPEQELEFDFVRKQLETIAEINQVFIKHNISLFDGFAILNNMFISRLGVTSKLTTEQKWKMFYNFFYINLETLRENTSNDYDPIKMFKELSEKMGVENTVQMIDKLNKSLSNLDSSSTSDSVSDENQKQEQSKEN